MKIVIAGAGSVGYHLAKLLSKENQDITLIDYEEDILDNVSSKLDVLTLRGNANSISILEEADVGRANLFIAVTTSEDTNLLTAILAKQIGAKKTIARVNNTEFLRKEQREYFAKIGVDTIISPHELAVKEIKRLINQSSLTDIFDFEEGRIRVVGFTVDEESGMSGKQVAEICNGNAGFDYRGVALLRDHKTIIPKGRTTLETGDHLYLSVKGNSMDDVMPFIGKPTKSIKNIMVIGDTPLALRTAEVLQDDFNVTVIMSSKEKGKKFLQKISNTLIIIGDPSNEEILEQEGLSNMDAFIALTPNSEINILTSLVANKSGVYKTIALVDNEIYTHISQNIGVDTIINKKLIAANNIFRFVRKGNVEAIATLHGVEAEIIEFEITKSNRITNHTLGELHLPESSIVAGVIRGEKSIIPGGNFQLEKGDKVIIFALPEAIKKVEETFK